MITIFFNLNILTHVYTGACDVHLCHLKWTSAVHINVHKNEERKHRNSRGGSQTAEKTIKHFDGSAKNNSQGYQP